MHADVRDKGTRQLFSASSEPFTQSASPSQRFVDEEVDKEG